MDPQLLAVATLYAGATQNAFVVLAKCLVDNGALKPGQFSSAIKSTFNEADRRGLDYQFSQRLAQMLDETRDKK
jgi:membrane-bound lytic murein transglycosylase